VDSLTNLRCLHLFSLGIRPLGTISGPSFARLLGILVVRCQLKSRGWTTWDAPSPCIHDLTYAEAIAPSIRFSRVAYRSLRRTHPACTPVPLRTTPHNNRAASARNRRLYSSRSFCTYLCRLLFSASHSLQLQCPIRKLAHRAVRLDPANW
jgi:hypothetical protein